MFTTTHVALFGFVPLCSTRRISTFGYLCWETVHPGVLDFASAIDNLIIEQFKVRNAISELPMTPTESLVTNKRREPLPVKEETKVTNFKEQVSMLIIEQFKNRG